MRVEGVHGKGEARGIQDRVCWWGSPDPIRCGWPAFGSWAPVSLPEQWVSDHTPPPPQPGLRPQRPCSDKHTASSLQAYCTLPELSKASLNRTEAKVLTLGHGALWSGPDPLSELSSHNTSRLPRFPSLLPMFYLLPQILDRLFPQPGTQCPHVSSNSLFIPSAFTQIITFSVRPSPTAAAKPIPPPSTPLSFCLFFLYAFTITSLQDTLCVNICPLGCWLLQGSNSVSLVPFLKTMSSITIYKMDNIL